MESPRSFSRVTQACRCKPRDQTTAMPAHGPRWSARPSHAKTWYLGTFSTNFTVPANVNRASSAAGSGLASPMRTSTATAIIKAIRRTETETVMTKSPGVCGTRSIFLGAQTERRGDAGLVRGLPGGKASPTDGKTHRFDTVGRGSGHQGARAVNVRGGG